jgi:hypothetical protein
MMKFSKSFQVFALIFLLSAFFIAAIGPNVSAATQASLGVLASVGGTTAPAAADTAYTYDDGTAVVLTATPLDGYIFQNWVIDTSSEGSMILTDNPATLTVTGGVTYAVQASFQPVQPIIGTAVNTATDAIVVVLPSVGGTTSPAAGTYALTNAKQTTLTATPSSGFEFVAWVIGGTPLSHGAYSFTDTPTDNPYTVDHGYGNTYTYQAIFKPIGSTIPEFPVPAILAVALVAIAMGTFVYKRKK